MFQYESDQTGSFEFYPQEGYLRLTSVMGTPLKDLDLKQMNHWFHHQFKDIFCLQFDPPDHSKWRLIKKQAKEEKDVWTLQKKILWFWWTVSKIERSWSFQASSVEEVAISYLKLQLFVQSIDEK